MSYGGMDFSWLSNLFSASPNVTAGVDPSAWTQQMGPAMQTPPMGAGMNPEMGGGTGRVIGMQAVDALGPGGGNVNAASAVMAGQQPGALEALLDRLGIGTPGKMSPETAKALEALMKMGAQQTQQRGQGGSPVMPAMPMGQGQVRPLPQAQRSLPRYAWTSRAAPAGLLYDGER